MFFFLQCEVGRVVSDCSGGPHHCQGPLGSPWRPHLTYGTCVFRGCCQLLQVNDQALLHRGGPGTTTIRVCRSMKSSALKVTPYIVPVRARGLSHKQLGI